MRIFRRAAALLLCAALAAQAADPASEITEHYTRMMKYHGYMDGSVPEGAVLFIGDSRRCDFEGPRGFGMQAGWLDRKNGLTLLDALQGVL